MYLTLGRAEPAPRMTTETPGSVSPLALVPDTTTDEFRAVCRVDTKMKSGRHSFGSGVLITTRHVLTCAHVIFPPEEPNNTFSIHVFVAQNGPAAASNGIKADGWAVKRGWSANCCRSWDEDYGIIRLSKDAPTPFWPMPPFDPRCLMGKDAYLAGYPARERDPQAQFMHRTRGPILGSMQIASCTAGEIRPSRWPAIDDTTRLVEHRLDTAKAISGGPLWSVVDHRRILWGLHGGNFHGGASKYAILLNKGVRAEIAHWVSHGLTGR